MMKSDSQLQIDVMDELTWVPGLDHERIGVSVTSGVVTLSGTVRNYAEKVLAEKTARVKGVRAVAERPRRPLRLATQNKRPGHRKARRRHPRLGRARSKGSHRGYR